MNVERQPTRCVKHVSGIQVFQQDKGEERRNLAKSPALQPLPLTRAKMKRGTKFKAIVAHKEEQPEEQPRILVGKRGRGYRKLISDVIWLIMKGVGCYSVLAITVLVLLVEPAASSRSQQISDRKRMEKGLQFESGINIINRRSSLPEELPRSASNFSGEQAKMIEWPYASRLLGDEIESKQDDSPASLGTANGRSKQHLIKLLSRPRQILSAFVPQTLTKQLVIGRPDNLMAANLKRIHKKLYPSATTQKQPETTEISDHLSTSSASFSGYAQLMPVTLIQPSPQTAPVAGIGSFNRPPVAVPLRPPVPMKAGNLLPTLPSPRQIVVVNKLAAPQSRFMFDPLQQHHHHHHGHRQQQLNQHHHFRQQQSEYLPIHNVPPKLIRLNKQPMNQASELASEPELDNDRELETEREMEHIDEMIRSEFDNHVSMNEHRSPQQRQQQELLVGYVRNGSSLPNQQQGLQDNEEAQVDMWDQAPEAATESDAEQAAENRWRPAELPQLVRGSGAGTGNAHPTALGRQDNRESQFKPVKLHFKPLVVESVSKLSTSSVRQQPFVPTALETIARLNSSSTSTSSQLATTTTTTTTTSTSGTSATATATGTHNNGGAWLKSGDTSTLPFSSSLSQSAIQGINDTKAPSSQSMLGLATTNMEDNNNNNDDDDDGQLTRRAQATGFQEPHHKLPVVGRPGAVSPQNDGSKTRQQATVDSIEQLMTALSSSDYLHGKDAAVRLPLLPGPPTSSGRRQLQMQPLYQLHQLEQRAQPAALNDTLRKLRETKARIRQLQAELNATDPHLWRLTVNQTTAGGSHAANHHAETVPSSSDSSTTSLADWLRRWPSLTALAQQQQHHNLSQAIKNWNATSPSARMASALNLPIVFYHKEPLTVPDRMTAASPGTTQHGDSDSVVLGSGFSVTSGAGESASPAGVTSIQQQVSRNELSQPQVAPVNGSSIQIDLSSATASQESRPASVAVSSIAISSGDTISVSAQKLTPTDEQHQQVRQTQQVAATNSQQPPPEMQSREDRVVHTTPVWFNDGLPALPPSFQPPERLIPANVEPTLASPTTTTTALAGQLAATNRRLHHQLPALLQASVASNGSGSHDGYGQNSAASSRQQLARSRAGELQHGSTQFQPRLLTLNPPRAPTTGHSNLMLQPPTKPTQHQEPKMTTERLLHSLIGLSCSAAVASLLIIVALVRCHQVRRRQLQRRRSPLLKTVDANSSCVAGASSLKATSGSGPLASLCNQLDWRRFQSVSEANERQRHDKLILDGTMRNVSLLARYQSNERRALEERLDQQALACSTSSKVPLPTLNRSCCHCVTCSASWLFRDSGGEQPASQHATPTQSSQQLTGAAMEAAAAAADAGLAATGSENGQQANGCNQTATKQQNGRLLCSSGFYHPAPRGKLPFGAASSVNKFLAAHHDTAKVSGSSLACAASSSIRCLGVGGAQKLRHMARGGSLRPLVTSNMSRLAPTDTNNNHTIASPEAAIEHPPKQQAGGAAPQRLQLMSAIEQCLRNIKGAERSQRADLLLAIGELADDEEAALASDENECTCAQCGPKMDDAGELSSSATECTCQCRGQCQRSPAAGNGAAESSSEEDEDQESEDLRETKSAKQAIDNCDTSGYAKQHPHSNKPAPADPHTSQRPVHPGKPIAPAKGPHLFKPSLSTTSKN